MIHLNISMGIMNHNFS